VSLVFPSSNCLHWSVYENLPVKCLTARCFTDERERKRATEKRILLTTFFIRAIKLRKLRQSGYAEGVGEIINAYETLIRECEGKTTHLRPRRRWWENVKVDLGERMWTGYIWLRSRGDLVWTRTWTFMFPKRLWILIWQPPVIQHLADSRL
jgi:hypothetical protein